jgi:plastocyanin
MTNVLIFVMVAVTLFTTILGSNLGNHYVFAQENAVSIAPGSSNPSASQFYVPPEITISAGTTVTWTNDDSTIHTVTEGGPSGSSTGGSPLFDSSIIAPGATWEHTFDAAGEFDYYCTLHPFMTGKVIVN